MKFYAVTTAVYDSGKTTADITDVMEAEKQPENTFASTERKDIYVDWFPSKELAKDFARTVRES